jgi:hypothetical protein
MPSTVSGTTMTAGTTVSDSIGEVRTVPINSQTGAYNLASTDAGKFISITTGGVSVLTSSAFTAGQSVSIYNNSASSQNISITTDTMYLAGTATTGTRALAQRGVATILKVAVTTWVISGAGIT